MKTITDNDFTVEVLQSNIPVMVKFTAEWCSPCSAIQPTLEEIATELEGKAKIVKLDVDESPVTASKYRVKGIPTMMVFKNGELFTTQVGRDSKANLISLFGLDAEVLSK